jgi:hypothetical protein
MDDDINIIECDTSQQSSQQSLQQLSPQPLLPPFQQSLQQPLQHAMITMTSALPVVLPITLPTGEVFTSTPKITLNTDSMGVELTPINSTAIASSITTVLPFNSAYFSQSIIPHSLQPYRIEATNSQNTVAAVDDGVQNIIHEVRTNNLSFEPMDYVCHENSSNDQSKMKNSFFKLLTNVTPSNSNLPILIEHMGDLLANGSHGLNRQQIITIGRLIAYGVDKHVYLWMEADIHRMNQAIQKLSIWMCGLQRSNDELSNGLEQDAEFFLRGIVLCFANKLSLIHMLFYSVFFHRFELLVYQTNECHLFTPLQKTFSMF